ncbi:MAG: hypothetical protein MMC33_004518 [Icmadophila ericetorum]|nr:hypothetical protein [Icmadophila ericetorum]
MEKITDKLNALPPDANYFSLEFFPPKTQMGLSNLQPRLARMAHAFRPLFINVTWGAGGSTSDKSLELAEICQRQLGLTTCLHLTCTNMKKKLIDEALEEAKAMGVKNILALRGDPPRDKEYRLEGEEEEETDEPTLVWAADLVRYIRSEYGDYFCIGVAGYPEGHSDESHPADQNPLHDMPYLVEKVKAGADFIMTQLFYDIDKYLDYEKMVRGWDREVLGSIPIILGLMPIQNYQILKRVTKLSHASLPGSVLSRLEGIKNDDEAVKSVGVDILSDIIEKIKTTKKSTPGPRGFHFYTLNLEKVVGLILDRCHLIPPSTPEDNDLATKFNGISKDESHRPLRNGYDTPNNRVMTNSPAPNQPSTTTKAPPPSSDSHPSRSTEVAISQGLGSIGREATWDDYPNGRFGDARSPAFGEIDGYGPSLHLSPAAARSKWGFPTTREDIGTLFKKHVMGDLDQLPWSDGGDSGLKEETLVIRKELCDLIEQKGWWSVASQPAIDGLPSSDPTFGWGPKNGFVFQKAFVEFFVPATSWQTILRPHLLKPGITEEVSWYATDPTGADFESSELLSQPHLSRRSSQTKTAMNGVTWAVFPGKEIVTPTIIEEVSFRAWGEEAYGIWSAWERCYPVAPVAGIDKGVATRRLLSEVRQDVWLVNVICHAYREPGRLWEILHGA